MSAPGLRRDVGVVHRADPRRGRPALRDVITKAAAAPGPSSLGYRIPPSRRCHPLDRDSRPRARRRWRLDRRQHRRHRAPLVPKKRSGDQHEAGRDRRSARHAARERAARLRVLRPGAPLRPPEPAARRHQRCADRGAPGPRVSEVLPEVGPEVERMLRAVLETGAPISDVEITGQTPAQPGVERHWLASYYPVRGTDEIPVEFGAIVVEITERKRQERAARLTGASASCSRRARTSPSCSSGPRRSWSPSWPIRAGSTSSRAPMSRAGSRSRTRTRRWRRSWPKRTSAGRSTSRGCCADPGRAAPKDDPSWWPRHRRDADRVRHGPEHFAVAERLGVQSSIVAPLHVGDDVVGLLCLDYTTHSGRVYQPDDVALVEALADRIVLVLERAYLTGEATGSRAPGSPRPGERAADRRSRHRTAWKPSPDVVLPIFGDACVAYLRPTAGWSRRSARWPMCRSPRAPRSGRTSRMADIDGPGPVATAFRTREPVLVSEVPAGLGGAPGARTPLGSGGSVARRRRADRGAGVRLLGLRSTVRPRGPRPGARDRGSSRTRGRGRDAVRARARDRGGAAAEPAARPAAGAPGRGSRDALRARRRRAQGRRRLV